MPDPSSDDLPPPAAQDSFTRAFARFALPYFLGRGGLRARLLGFGLVLLVVAQVALMVRLNIWNADLFDALERRSTERFLRQMGVFALLVLGMMVANALHLQLKRDLQLDWRAWLTRRLAERWLSQGRHYALSQMASEHASNPDGRIAEDVRITTESAVDLASTLLNAALLVVSFLSILWVLSGILEVSVPWLDATLAVPGHMVALALLYSTGGSAVAFLLGRSLVRATDARQGREADFRYALTRARENAEALAMARAEPEERARLTALFGLIGQVWAEQTRTLRGLLLFSVGYGQLAPVLPLLVTTPRYLAGTLTLGGLVQMAQAFQQVTAALSWPVDNAQRLAEWRASAERVLALRAAIAALDAPGGASLHGAPLREGGVVLDGLVLQNPDGTAVTQLLHERFAHAEGVHLTGDPHATTLLCKAIAGHWHWGKGSVHLSEGVTPAIRIAASWLPKVALQDLLAGPGTADPAAMTAALRDVGLDRLAGKLTATEAWDSILPEGDRQRLMFASLLVRGPQVVVLDHALQALPPEAQTSLLGALRRWLPKAIIVLAGPLPPNVPGFERVLDLDKASVSGPARAVQMPRRGATVDWLQRGFGYRR